MSGSTESPTQPESAMPAQDEKYVLSDPLSVEEIATVEVVPCTLGDTVEAIPSATTKAMRHQWWIQFTALCMASFLVGWIGGMFGPIVPRLQAFYINSHYNAPIGWVQSLTGPRAYEILTAPLRSPILLLHQPKFMGYISAACAYVYLMDRFGFGGMTVGASVLVAIGYAIETFAPPFPALLVSCFLMGFGAMFLDGGSRFIASLVGDTSVKMSIRYVAQGVGSTCAPLAVTQLVRLPRWPLVVLFPIGFCLITAVCQAFAFKFKSQEDCLKAIGQPPHKSMHAVRSIEKYKKVLRLPAVHAMALFQLTYSGFELAFIGWIVTFVLKERHGGPNSGYVSSGFFGGSTLGRLILIPLTKRVGMWRVMFVYLLLSLGLELVIWLVPSFTVTAVAISLLGIFLGPVTAIPMAHVGRVLPPELVGGAISWMALCASTGSLVFPFIVGAITSRTSINNLPPIIIAMLGAMLVIWAFVPKDRVRLI
ncbi:hypothetical protein GSI_14642 [Ganoderma sinense ZZ0214-1]|uniref:Major facilitator superfamily (MFS) profile domain-containing protein n=1 Tax=Ganoderma sinense ZZ0214-1 TaxID=1077348 RepID=A0A2G8RPA9_9APHY|nr:hypothetical protein GSI_14642 [Ganoderma sinense ZZ0214-1]